MPSGKAAKQADRRAMKKAGSTVEDDAPSGNSGSIVACLKTLIMGSCLVTLLPKLPGMLGAPVKEAAPKKEDENGKTEGEGDEVKEESNGDSAETSKDSDDPLEIFGMLKARLIWHNILGLAAPADGEKSKEAWLDLKKMEVDFGPKSKKASALDRIMCNLDNNMVQYLHVMLALMMLRAFLFRSFFACLPWLVGYQLASLMIPLGLKEALGKFVPKEHLDKVPLEKVLPGHRIAVTLGINALVWLFFVYEFLWCAWFFEKIPLVGLICYHAYAVRPADPKAQ